MLKKVFIYSLIIFGFGFITHNLYTWFPSFITTIFPVNESLYEHAKMIFLTPIIIGIIYYFIVLKKDIKYNNYFMNLFISSLFNIIIFYILYLPLYYRFGEEMIITLIIYFISILLSQYLNFYLLKNTKDSKLLNIIGIILIFITNFILLYFTYNPIKTHFFFDTVNEIYGIKP